jgi:hypothetical protein
MSFAEALQSKADQTQQSHPRQDAAAATVAVASSQWQEAAGQSVAAPTVHSHCQGSNCTAAAATVAVASPQWQEAAGQSVAAPTVHSLPLDNMASVQQFMAEVNDAISKEAKIQAISKIVLTLLEQNAQ